MEKLIYEGPLSFYAGLDAFLQCTKLIDSYSKLRMDGAGCQVSIHYFKGAVLRIEIFDDILIGISVGDPPDFSKSYQKISIIGYGEEKYFGELEKKIQRDILNQTVESAI